MTKPEVIQEMPVSMAEVKAELGKIRKKVEKLNFRAERTEEYLNQFVTLDAKKNQELRDAIDKLKIPRLKEEHIVKILNMLPTTADDVKASLQGYTVTITNENIKKIAEAVKSFLEK